MPELWVDDSDSSPVPEPDKEDFKKLLKIAAVLLLGAFIIFLFMQGPPPCKVYNC